MRLAFGRILYLVLTALVVGMGCSKTEKKYVVKGTLTKSGKPLVAPAGAVWYPQMVLYPESASDTRTYPAQPDLTNGAFELHDIPAGKYRFTLTLDVGGSDALKGKFHPERSKKIVEVTGSQDDMIIDLDK
jgi:hypothetical protein